MSDPGYIQGDNGVRGIEQTFLNILSPIEPLVMKVQSLLVWENPKKSALLFLFIHGVFWYVAVHGCQFYFTVSAVTLILYVTHTWKRKIWPEIRVPPPFPDDPDSWTPVHARLLSVPEICQKLTHIWLVAHNYVNCWLAFRINHHFLFCVVNSSVLVLLAGLGKYISDFTLTYIIVISVLLWPCVLYNKLLSRVYLDTEPLWMKLDYSLKLKPKWIFKGIVYFALEMNTGTIAARAKTSLTCEVHVQRILVSLATVVLCDVIRQETDSDTEDYIPSPDPLAAALARAITDSEDEGGAVGPEPLGEMSEITSPGMSRERAEDLNGEQGDAGSDSDEEFALGVSEMPSLDDVLEHTDDELLDSLHPGDEDDTDSLPQGYINDTNDDSNMAFIPTHFGDSDFEEDHTANRDFSGLDLSNSDTGDSKNRNEQKKKEADPSAPTTMSKVTGTLASVMGSAFSGLSTLTQSAIGGSPKKDTESKPPGAGTSSQEGGAGSKQGMDVHDDNLDSYDRDISEDFEFLDDYDEQEK
ncbi:hypothetical protein FSP39_009472 [Pinctada imbricata]|uniref:RETREG1-3/ARL6IP-like N-terminal reticulon-homology domain-containing protein n=1 Tax=Pinctada imbricata TaxID=66713 RepID=A0AA88YM56_PINIB|nr:hypothetical protein FSP39_009472 [Pinctada imbricata]